MGITVDTSDGDGLLFIVYMLVLFLPLYSAIVSGLMGRKIGEKGAGIIGVVCIIVS